MESSWLDRTEYPFESHSLPVNDGRMHYIDVGQGAPIVFVHGTPTWSFLYRHLISDLARDHRCIAADNLGFGLSDKPAAADYSFAAHTRNLTSLVDHLGLREFTLVVHDLGGPIGLGYALDHPERISRLVLFNTTLWPMAGEFAAPPLAKLFGTAVGRFLYLNLNISPRTLLPMVYGDRAKLTPSIHQHYLAPFPRPDDRHALYSFAREMAAGAPSLAGLWERRATIANIPALLIWGMKDPAFGPRFLARWQSFFPNARSLSLPDAGHLVQEEAPAEVVAAMRSFVAEPVPVV